MIENLNKYGKVLEQVSLKEYNTYRIGGIAKYLIEVSDVQNLKDLISYLKTEHIKYMVLGGGSNVIFSDKLYDGVIIKLTGLNHIKIDGTNVIAEAGAMIPKVAIKAVNHNLKGLEWATGIPGTIGGCIVNNAGAYKECIFDYIKEVTVLNENNEIKTILKKDIAYSYRHTMFKDNKNLIIIEVVLELLEGNKEESLDIIKRRTEKRLATQPLNYPSAGSVFRNPPDDFAGRIIEFDVNLKGKMIGGAKISEKHANFIINYNNATSQDVKDLIDLIHDKVLEHNNLDLIVEQEFINWE